MQTKYKKCSNNNSTVHFYILYKLNDDIAQHGMV